MESLPDEVLDLVFGLLSTKELVLVCSRVCRRWAFVSERRVLQVEHDEDLERVRPGLRALHVSVPFHKLSRTLDVATRLPLLTQLTVHAGSPLCARHVAALPHLPRLQHLDIFTRPQVYDASLLPVLSYLSTIVINETVAPGLLRQLCIGTSLKCLHMYGRSRHYPKKEMMGLISIRSSYLTELTLRCTELPDKAYKVIGSCLNLTSLQLYSCWLLTSAGAVHVTRPRKLTRLHVTGARLVRRKALSNLLDQLPPYLEELSLSLTWFGDEHVQTLIEKAPRIRELELWRCKSLTMNGLLELAGNLPHLQVLDSDMMFYAEEIQRLNRHGSLRWVRCMYMDSKEVVSHVGAVRVVQRAARYPRKYFRSGGDGFRSSLYYYWTRGIPLEPLPWHAPPTYQEDDEF